MTSLLIDARAGRLGDCWMRLVAFSAAAAHRSKYALEIVTNPVLEPLAKFLFSPYLKISSDLSREPDYVFSAESLASLTFRNYHPRRAAPYHTFVFWNRPPSTFKEQVKHSLLHILNRSNLLYSPSDAHKYTYLGYAEITSLPPFRDISWIEFSDQIKGLSAYLQNVVSSQLRPQTLRDLAVFPSGTAQQYIPATWAAAHLPTASFYFHEADSRAYEFSKAGLLVNTFASPREIVEIAMTSAWCVSTDSFPSHILQVATRNLTLCLTHELGIRTVLPSFAGKIVESHAECAPCAGPNPDPALCQRGFSECITWSKDSYLQAVMSTIP